MNKIKVFNNLRNKHQSYDFVYNLILTWYKQIKLQHDNQSLRDESVSQIFLLVPKLYASAIHLICILLHENAQIIINASLVLLDYIITTFGSSFLSSMLVTLAASLYKLMSEACYWVLCMWLVGGIFERNSLYQERLYYTSTQQVSKILDKRLELEKIYLDWNEFLCGLFL